MTSPCRKNWAASKKHWEAVKASGAAGGLKDAVARPPAEAVRLPSDEAVAVKEARAAGTGAHGMGAAPPRRSAPFFGVW